MDRRDALAKLAGIGICGFLILGTFADEIRIDAKFKYTPPNPTVGEGVVFDASESVGDYFHWYIDKNNQKPSENTISEPDKKGKVVTHEFDDSGPHAVTLRVLMEEDLNGTPTAETSKVIYVNESKQTPNSSDIINAESNTASIQLRGSNTRIAVGETTNLTFSAVNLTEQTVSFNLILKVPSGLNISGSSFVESGLGQYAATFTSDPSEVVGTSIQVEATREGQFDIKGIAQYTTENGNETTHQGTFSLTVTE